MRWKANQLVEVEFLDHSSWATGWKAGGAVIENGDVVVRLVGYFVGETKVSYIFGMCYDIADGKYGPTFNVLKKVVRRVRRLR